MIDPVQMFEQGGVATLLSVIVALGGLLLAAIVPLIIGFLRLRVPASLGWMGLTLGLVVGLLGAMFGARQVSQAIAMASPEMVQVLMAAGISIALYSMAGAYLIAAPGFLLSSFCTALPGPIRPGDDARFDGRAVMGAVGGAAAGWIIAVLLLAVMLGSTVLHAGIGFYVLILAALLATTFPILSSLRVASEDHAQQSRMAGLRGLTTFSALIALILFGELFTNMGIILAFKAVAVAAPDQKTALLTVGMQVAGYTRTIGWILTIPVLLAGCGAVFPILGRADNRVAIGAGLAGLQVLIVLAVLFMSASQVSSTFDMLAGR